MSRIVDIEQLGCLIWKDGEHGKTFDDGVLWVLDKIGELPTIEPEHKTGKWEEHIFDGPMGRRPKALMCSCCNALCLFAYDYCPRCGADMRKRTDE